MKYPVVEQKIIVISEEPEIPPKIPTKTKTPRNSKIVKTTQTTNNQKAVHKGDWQCYVCGDLKPGKSEITKHIRAEHYAKGVIF